MTKINQALGELFKKSFWLTKEHKKLIETEAAKNWGKNQSALMRHIINSWFKK